MSISSNVRKAGPYTGNGTTADFPFSFKVFQTSEVVVVQTDIAGAEATLALTTDYTVVLNTNQDANPGGTVTALVAPAAGVLITLTSSVAITQGTTLTNQGGFYPSVLNDALDKLTIVAQEASGKQARSLTLPLSDTATPPDLPVASQRVDTYLAFDVNGDPTVTPTSTVANDAAAAAAPFATAAAASAGAASTSESNAAGSASAAVNAATTAAADTSAVLIAATSGDASAAAGSASAAAGSASTAQSAAGVAASDTVDILTLATSGDAAAAQQAANQVIALNNSIAQLNFPLDFGFTNDITITATYNLGSV